MSTLAPLCLQWGEKGLIPLWHVILYCWDQFNPTWDLMPCNAFKRNSHKADIPFVLGGICLDQLQYHISNNWCFLAESSTLFSFTTMIYRQFETLLHKQFNYGYLWVTGTIVIPIWSSFFKVNRKKIHTEFSIKVQICQKCHRKKMISCNGGTYQHPQKQQQWLIKITLLLIMASRLTV